MVIRFATLLLFVIKKEVRQMTIRRDLECAKRQEMCKVISSLGIGGGRAEQLMERLEDEGWLAIYPPEEPEHRMQYMVISSPYSGRGEGTTYKPGNIIINLKKSILSSAELLFSSGAAAGCISHDNPGVAVLTILSTLFSVAKLSKISLAQDESFILAVLWENQQKNMSIEQSLVHVNQKRRECNKKIYTEEDYMHILDDLAAIKSIEIVNDTIIMKEQIRIEYH